MGNNLKIFIDLIWNLIHHIAMTFKDELINLYTEKCNEKEQELCNEVESYMVSLLPDFMNKLREAAASGKSQCEFPPVPVSQRIAYHKLAFTHGLSSKDALIFTGSGDERGVIISGWSQSKSKPKFPSNTMLKEIPI
jgi:hypothetical protein